MAFYGCSSVHVHTGAQASIPFVVCLVNSSDHTTQQSEAAEVCILIKNLYKCKIHRAKKFFHIERLTLGASEL